MDQKTANTIAVHMSLIPLRRRDRARQKSGAIVFRRARGDLFVGRARATDARQGLIGDCYLLAAFSAVAYVDPDRIESMIRPDRMGKFTVTFQKRLENGKFAEEIVTVDDRVPILRDRKLPLYARSSPARREPQATWPMIMEKAYAAWKGGYDVIGEGGAVEDVLEEITGEPTRMLFTAEHNPDLLWSLLLRAPEEKWPVTVCTYNRAARPGLDELGLHPYHIHLLLDAHELRGRKFITLRDPFDKPTCGKLTCPDSHGVFTMQWQDFLTYFVEIHINGRSVFEVPSPPYPRAGLSDALDASYVFRALNQETRRRLARSFSCVEVAAGKSIVVQNTPGDAFFFIKTGSAGVEVIDPKTKRKRRVAILNAGDQFGEMSLIDGAPRRSDVVALTPVVLYRMSAKKFRAWIERHPELVKRMRRRFGLQLWMQKNGTPMNTLSLDELLAAGIEESFSPGRIILTEGEVASSFYLLLVGEIEIFIRGRTVTLLRGGEIFGETAAAAKDLCAASARARTKSLVMRMEMTRIAKFTNAYDAVQRQLEFIARRRLKMLSAHRRQLITGGRNGI